MIIGSNNFFARNKNFSTEINTKKSCRRNGIKTSNINVFIPISAQFLFSTVDNTTISTSKHESAKLKKPTGLQENANTISEEMGKVEECRHLVNDRHT